MNYLFLEYAKCSTCRRARKWLDEHGITYETRPIVEQNPSAAELKAWIGRSGLAAKQFFNTSGQVYKALQLKDKLPALSEAEQIEWLASDGKLVKRPLLVGDDRVWVGFKPDQWEKEVK